MRGWCKLLPLFLVRWYASRHCEVFTLPHGEYVQPWPDTLFRVVRCEGYRAWKDGDMVNLTKIRKETM